MSLNSDNRTGVASGEYFTTKDQDNDDWIDGNKKLFPKRFKILFISSLFIFSKGNCSEFHTGGWWFDGKDQLTGYCGNGNLNGILGNDYNEIYPNDKSNEHKIAFWGDTKIVESIMGIWRP